MANIELKHNFEDFAKELENLSKKQFNSMFKQSLKRSLNSGKNKAKNLVKTKLVKPKSEKSFPSYFNKSTRVSFIKGNIDSYEAHIRFSAHRHGLAQYITDSKLDKHRKATAKRGFKKKARKKITPLQAKIIPGRKTILRKAFAAKKGGKGKWQVFRRKRNNKRLPLDRPTGPSVASTIRSNEQFTPLIKKEISKTYFKNFNSNLKYRTDQMRKKLSSAKLK